jgi:putative phosphonate catabolism associated alcohol dehydrogenase
MNSQLSSYQPGKAVIFNGHGLPFEFITKPVPALHAGEILVRVLYTTLCGSDIHTYCGRRLEPPNVVLGHEITGDILMIDTAHPHTDLRGETIGAGDRVTWSIFAVPEGIVAPKPDMPQKSDQLFKYGHHLASGDDVFNGGLAEYCILRANTALIKISPSIPLKVGATISCAHSTVAGALRVAGEIAGKKVLIFGAGLLGLSCVAMCREAGATLIGLIDTDATRVKWGKKFGADDTYLFGGGEAPGGAPEASGLAWPEADIVFDMTGNPQAMKTGIDSLLLGGCAIWIGAVFPAPAVQVDAQKIVRKLLQIRGLHNYNYEDFIRATEFVEHNYDKYPFEELVETEYPLDEVENAFEFASEQKPVRVGVKMS